jgi:hypothetical protein
VGSVLVICSNANIRRFYVDNLTVRGFAAKGITSLSHDSTSSLTTSTLEPFTPDLVLLWGELATLEPDIQKIRQSYPSSVSIVVVSEEKPGPEWITKWAITAHRSSLSDSRQLMNVLQRWLT